MMPQVLNSVSPVSDWPIQRQSIVRDAALTDTLYNEGFAVVPFLNAADLEILRAVYAKEHSISSETGGIFYSLYSQNLEYRERVNAEVGAVMEPRLQEFFHSYKTVLNGFIIKVPGPKSGFLIHQDTTGLDESKYSTLSVWVPLWDIGPEDGAMCMVRRSHKMFYPYRGISFAFPFDKIHGTVKRYLEPVYMKAGEALIFDQRTLHASLPNKTDKNRVVVVSGLFPKEAEFRMCYRESEDAPVEIYRQADDFILKYPRFMHDCRSRPIAGEKIAEFDFPIPMMTAEEFEAKAAAAGLQPLDLIAREDKLGCNPMPEPDGVERAPLAPLVKVRTEAEIAASTAVAATAPIENKGSGNWFQRLFGK